ncbi:MAG: tetratricopeptide repeat protein, partial [Desulfobacteraceae bacterium]
TDICFNYGVRLKSRELDIDPLLDDEHKVSDILPEDSRFGTYRFTVEASKGEKRLGLVRFQVQPSVSDWLERADRIIDAQRRLEFLEKALDAHPEDQKLKERTVRELMSAEKWERAALLLEKTAEDEADEAVLEDLLVVYRAMGDPGGVISVLRRLVQMRPQDPETRYALAQELEETGDLEEAVVEYEGLLPLLESEADRAEVLKTLGYLYARLEREKKAIDRYTKALEFDTKDVNLYYNLAGLHDRAGDRDEADQYLAKAVEMEEGDVKSRIRLAERAVEKKRWADAEQHLEGVLKREPSNLEALLLLVKVAEEQDDRKRLKGLYTRILELAPDNHTVLYNLAVLEYEAGDFKRCLEHLERYLEARSEDHDARRLLFEAQAEAGEEKAAYRTALRLLESEPGEVSYYHYIFDHLKDRGRYDEIIGLIKKGLEENPNHHALQDYLIAAYLEAERPEEAMEAMSRALETRPEDADLMLDLGRLAERLGELERAEELYRRLLDLDPDHQEARRGLIGVLMEAAAEAEASGDADRALEIYQEVLDINPENQVAEEAYLELRMEMLTR